MMTKATFKNLVYKMVDIYGVRSYLDNIEEDMTEEDIDDDLWFECPECGEPILYEDWDLDEYVSNAEMQCPICEELLEFQ